MGRDQRHATDPRPSPPSPSDFHCTANPFSIQLYDGTACDLISRGKNGKAASGAISHKYIDINIFTLKTVPNFLSDMVLDNKADKLKFNNTHFFWGGACDSL